MNIPTAEEFLDKYRKEFNDNGIVFDYSKVMIKYTKLHVTEALKQASKKGYSLDWKNAKCEINKESILNSYPLTNIK